MFLYKRYPIRPTIGLATDPRTALAEVKAILGDTSAALTLSQAAYADSLRRNDLLNASTAQYILTNVALAEGDFDRAREHVNQATALTRQVGNDWFLAYCLNQQGHICREQGDYTSAQHYYEESYHIRQSFGDPEGQAVALIHLGNLALLQDQYDHSLELFAQCLPIYERIEDRGGLFAAHHGLAIAQTTIGDFDSAQQHLIQATQIAADIQLASWWLALCEASGEFFAATGALERGIGLVILALQHPESNSTTRVRAQNWLQRIGQDPIAAPPDLDSAVEQLKSQLSRQTWNVQLQSPDPADDQQIDLVEALSARELEILRLIEAGMTNQEIADQLVLTVGTVKSHNYNIYGKLGVRNRSQAVKRAKGLNLL